MSKDISVHNLDEFAPPTKMVNMHSFINEEHYLRLAFCLLFVGLSIMAWFFLYLK
jgi:hypothetical protein